MAIDVKVCNNLLCKPRALRIIAICWVEAPHQKSIELRWTNFTQSCDITSALPENKLEHAFGQHQNNTTAIT